MAQWLAQTLGHNQFSLSVASADASFRQYLRLNVAEESSLIVMDAPPDKENCQPFIQVQALLHQQQVPVPEVLAFDPTWGFMLLTDLGDQQLLSHLNDSNVMPLYQQAIRIIEQIQSTTDLAGLPAYDETLLRTEMQLFSDWFLGHHLGVRLSAHEQGQLNTVTDALVSNALEQPQVMVHRDFHSRNLMWQTDQTNPNGRLSVIDFQDAVVGPDTYDLVSLLKDCYIAWPDTVLDPLLQSFFQNNRPQDSDYLEFVKQFDWMGAQRHLKAIGIFCRLNYRDGKSGYLNDIPLTMKHLLRTCRRHDALLPLADILDHHLPRIKP